MRRGCVERARERKISARCSIMLALIGAMLVIVSVGACLIAKGNAQGVTKYFTPFSRTICGVWGRIMSVFPFSMAEVMLYLMVAGFIASVFLLIFRWARRGGRRAVGRYFSVLLLIAGCHATFFVFTWGLNYYGEPLSEQLGMRVELYSEKELLETTKFYLGLANSASEKVDRRESDGAVDTSDTNAVFNAVCEEYRSQKLFDWDGALISKPKKVMSWYLLSCFDIAGIYDPFTSECMVNTDCSPVSLPFSACHELAHRLGYSPENEANFVAVILCRESENEILSYSGDYMGFIYCYNALARIDREAAAELWASMSEGLKADIQASNVHAAKYADKVTIKVSAAVNDTYLKLMDQSGIQSYGEVVDMLISEYIGGTL